MESPSFDDGGGLWFAARPPGAIMAKEVHYLSKDGETNLALRLEPEVDRRDQVVGAGNGQALLRAPNIPGLVPLHVASNGAIASGRPILAFATQRRMQRFPDDSLIWIDTDSVPRTTTPPGFIYRDGHDVRDVSIGFGSGTIRTSVSQAKLVASEKPAIAEVDFTWPIAPDTDDARIRVEVQDDGKLVGSAEGAWADRKTLPWVWRRPLVGGTYRVTVHVSDELGSDITASWPEVHIERPWYEGVIMRTLLAAIIVIVVFFVLAAALARQAALARWAPVIVTVGGSVATKLPAIETALQINAWLLISLVVCVLALTIPLGALDLTAFRALARTAPFEWAAPIALRIPRARRRLFGPHGASLSRTLILQRDDANQESYVNLPASSFGKDKAAVALTAPCDDITKLLLARDRVNLVYIEAPGGRGKSALVRACLARLWTEFERGNTRRVPVLCTLRHGASVAASVEDALKAQNPLPRGLADELRDGGIVVVVDGLTGPDLTAEDLREFVCSEEATKTPMLLAGRPEPATRTVLDPIERTTLVEPLHLDNATLDAFVDTYVKVDLENHREPLPVLNESVKRICRAPWSSKELYVPIFVRLAVRLGKDAESLPMLYDEYFRLQLRAKGADEGLLTKAATLCAETFWEDGYRKLAYRHAKDSRKETIKHLLNAGVLVPVGAVAKNEEAQEVRFFHDSMQSYLTARALFAAGQWDGLPRAAGFSRFVEVQDGRARSEVLEMCLHVFRPKEKLRDELVASLRKWADALDARWLRKEDVWVALEPDESRALRARLDIDPRDRSAGNLLHEAINLLQPLTAEGPMPALVRLYGQIASLACRYLPGLEATVPPAVDAVLVEEVRADRAPEAHTVGDRENLGRAL